MGFMDKAKKLAEQAQQKLDEAQESINQQTSQQGGERPAAPATTSTGGRSGRRRPPARLRRRAAEPAGASAAEPTPEPAAPSPRRRRPPATPTPLPTPSSRSSSDERFGRPHMAIGGILTAMVTPFDANGELDEDAAVRLMRHLCENGSDGLVLTGSTGEAATLTDDEKARLWELAVAERPDGATIVAGTGTYDTRHTVELTERAAQIGVDAVLVVTPYYVKPNRRGIVAHYKAAAGASHVPVILYNIPSRTAMDMPNDLLAELAQIEGIEAVKQARYEDLAPIDGLDLLAGNDDVLPAGARHGRHGRHPRGVPPGRSRDAAHDRRA